MEITFNINSFPNKGYKKRCEGQIKE